MVDDDQSGRYYGPFGPPPEPGPDDETRPLGIGHWQSDGPDFRSGPPPVGPRQPAAEPTVRFPAPPGVPPVQPLPPYVGVSAPGLTQLPPPTGRPSGRPRRVGAAVVVGAGVTALIVGSAAGFGGAKLAQGPLAGPISAAPSASPAGPPSTVPPTAPLPSTSALPKAPQQFDTVRVAATVLPSTVMIRAGSGSQGATGSGFVLDAQGHVMTNNHVVAGAADGGRITVISSDGRRTSATIVGRSPSYDLAVIKVRSTNGLKPIQLGNSDATQVGESVIAVGSPLGLPGTVTQGIISAKNRPVVVSGDEDADAPSAYINGIQTDAPINPGNSGGPLIDAGARVIGVNSAILTLGQSQGQSGNIGLGFAIPVNQAVQIGRLLIKDGKATYPVIGANVQDEDEGVTLSAVQAGGPAAKAGLRTNDIITGIDGRAVDGMEELVVIIRTHRPGDRVTLAYERGQRKATANVTLGSREG